jgi:hypothetical protein
MIPLPELPPVALELLAHLQEDARTVVPLRVRDEDRASALSYVHEMLFNAPVSWVHFDHTRHHVPALPVSDAALVKERGDAVVKGGLEPLTNEELAQLLLSHRALSELCVLLCRRGPKWCEPGFRAVGERIAAQGGWPAPPRERAAVQ